MTEIQKEIIEEKQLKVDLIEHGIIRAMGTLIEEAHAAVENDTLTLDKLRMLTKRISTALAAYDRTADDLRDSIIYYEKSDKKASENAEVGDNA